MSTIAKLWKEPRCLLTDERMKMWCIYTMEYYAAIKNRNLTICNNVDGTRGYYAKRNKPIRERQLSYRRSPTQFSLKFVILLVINTWSMGAWVAQWVKPLPSAQVMISGSWDQGPHRALCSAGSLLPSLSLCLPLHLLVISLCQINK